MGEFISRAVVRGVVVVERWCNGDGRYRLVRPGLAWPANEIYFFGEGAERDSRVAFDFLVRMARER